MNYEQIHTRSRERQSEYSAGQAESTLRATFNAGTHYARMTQEYRTLLSIIEERASEKLETTVAMTYTANADVVTLPAAAQGRPLLGVVWNPVVGDQQPLEEITRAKYDIYLRKYGSTAGIIIQPYGELWYFLDGMTKLRILPKPAQVLDLTLRYVAGLPVDLVAPTYDANGTITVPGDSANSPDFLPVEFHGLLATAVAHSFLSEVGNLKLEKEYEDGKVRLERWADRSPQDGPRYVHEED